MDVHKDSITACTMTPEGKEIQTFSTKTVFLIQLINWIKKHGCTHVAMESTCVFWKPIVNLFGSIAGRSLSSSTMVLLFREKLELMYLSCRWD